MGPSSAPKNLKIWYWHWVNIIHFYSKWKICFIVADNYLSAGSCMETVVTQCDNQINGRINNQQPIKISLSLQSHWPTQLLFLAFYISYEPDKHRMKFGAISSVELKVKGRFDASVYQECCQKWLMSIKSSQPKISEKWEQFCLVSNWFWRHSADLLIHYSPLSEAASDKWDQFISYWTTLFQLIHQQTLKMIFSTFLFLAHLLFHFRERKLWISCCRLAEI